MPVAPGAELPYGKSRLLRVFAADHGSADLAVGYLVVERRRRLKPEYAALGDREIRALVKDGGRERLLEEYEKILFAHTGDTMPLAPGLFRQADLLVHDATFLVVEDRREPIHASTEEAIVTAREAGVRTLVLHHLSVRYERDDAIPALRRQVAELGFTGACWLLDGRSFIRLRRVNRGQRSAVRSQRSGRPSCHTVTPSRCPELAWLSHGDRLMVRHVRNLVVYQRLCALYVEICPLTKEWPREECFELASQVRRSSNSAAAQLAERYDDRHVKNQIEGVNRSRSEAAESVHHLEMARVRGFITDQVLEGLRDHYEECIRMLNGLERRLERRLPPSDRRWPGTRGPDEG